MIPAAPTSTCPLTGRPIIAVGIDLGTTNSLAAVVADQGPHALRDRDGEPLIPSVVHFPPGGGQPVVGSAARAELLDHPERTVFSVKRLVGRSAAELQEELARLPYPVDEGERGLLRIPIDGHAWSPEEISARVLEQVIRTAEEAVGAKIEQVVVTVPAWFDDAQRQATKDAVQLAGAECLRILNEPTAASLAYGIDGNRDGTVLVYDLGGGTFDVSVLRIRDGVFQVLATAGNTRLGGDDFDHLLAERILAALDRRAGTSKDLPPPVLNAIRRGAQGLKHRLTTSDRATLDVVAGDGEPVQVTVTRDEFEDVIGPLVEETLACCRRALKDAGLTFAKVDQVVLVGGSTRVPLVRELLGAASGKALDTSVDPDLAVALGAALQADALSGGARNHLLLDVIPLSLGIETMGSVVSKLILRNATIPISHTEEFSTQVDGQTAVDINIYQGERELVQDCRHLGSFKLRGIPPMPAGLPRVAVTFLVDADGVLRVSAIEQRTGVTAELQVVPSYGLTREEVHRMMNESIEHARDDMAAREEIELRNKASSMVRGTRKALALAELPPDQTWAIGKAVDKLELLLAADGPAGEVGALVDEISRLTGQIADDVISTAVAKALREEA